MIEFFRYIVRRFSIWLWSVGGIILDIIIAIGFLIIFLYYLAYFLMKSV
jgi:hypothetical protein